MISVVLTTYNRPEKLRRAIQSVIDQTYPDWELIVVDDHSPINPKDIVLGFNDKRIQFKRLKRNFGNHSRPKNVGTTMTKGEYVCYLDDDNVYRPDHLNVLVKALEANPQIDVVYGDRWCIIEETGEGKLGVTSDFNPSLLLQRNYIDTSDSLIRRDALMYVGGWDEEHRRFLDWNLYLRLAKAGYKFLHVPQIITDYYLHNEMLSMQTENKQDPNKPVWDPYECLIRLPYFGPVPEAKVAVFSITYDRLEYTKKSFESLNKTAGYKFDHFIVDNGSADGTQAWLSSYAVDTRHQYVQTIWNKDNKGISIASNQAIDLIKDTHPMWLVNKNSNLKPEDLIFKPGGSIISDNIDAVQRIDGPKYDIIVKFDNDCMCITEGWLAKMVEIWKSNHMMALSPYVQGLKDNPGGAQRVGYGQLSGELIGMTRHLGGICHFVSAKAYDNFRWPEDEQLHGMQDVEFSQHLLKEGYQMGYLENYFVSHGPQGTEQQYKDYPEYFERRKQEKVMRPQRSYEDIQETESAFSRGTPWGDRVKHTLELYKRFIWGKVLDIGCNDGYGLEILKEMGLDAEGIDVSTKVNIAIERGLKAQRGYMEDLPFEDKSFDTIICSHTLEHSKDIKKAVSEIQRVGKRAIIVVPIETNSQNPAHTSAFTSEGEVKDLFEGKTVHEERLNRMEHEYVLIKDLK